MLGDTSALVAISESCTPPTRRASFGTYDGTVSSCSMCLMHVRQLPYRLSSDLPATLDSNDILRHHLWPLQTVEASSLSESKIAKADQHSFRTHKLT